MKKVDLKWNVLIHDFNGDKIVSYNVLNNDYLIDSLKKAIKKEEVVSYGDVKEFLSRKFKAQYWSRAEYEILVSGLFDRSEAEKIDVWYQLEMNIDNITEYVITKLNLKIGGK